MEFEIAGCWYVAVITGLGAVYGVTQLRSLNALGYTRRPAAMTFTMVFLSTVFLSLSWVALGYLLPLFYVFAYLLRAARLLADPPVRRKDWFWLNLSYVNTMALHLSVIGIISLIRGIAMNGMLSDPLWRAFVIALTICINILEDFIFLKNKKLSSLLNAEAVSVEAGPFMAFLWFGTGYLLVDSLLCNAALEPVYPPLFLIGSCGVLMYLIIRFLFHINEIIQSDHYRDEHEQLEEKLLEKDRDAGRLKCLADRDVLTGVFSRRYAMEWIAGSIKEGKAFTIVFLDLDGLKQINDREGHDGGDRYLVRFAELLSAGLRDSDILARVGGDEFVILMPGCGEEIASRRISGIRDAMGAERFGDTAIRFSYGVTAMTPGTGQDAEGLIREADRAMYQDKVKRR